MHDTIRFLLGDAERTIAGVPPTRTVLEWLRGEARACGTKEGCAEGDCGACTVVLGEPDGDAMRWRAVNACILFAAGARRPAAADGGAPARPGRHMHPVQQAMVAYHGSQCGFCTPGFVMSLFALYHAGSAPDRQAANEALAGNLCRCTGYRPILDAAREACTGCRRPVRRSGGGDAARLRAMAPTSRWTVRRWRALFSRRARSNSLRRRGGASGRNDPGRRHRCRAVGDQVAQALCRP